MINDFLVKNWFDILQSGFIVSGFILSFFATRNAIRARKAEYLLHINQSHREIWGKTYSHPELFRIKEANIDLEKDPITDAEHRLVKEVIIHIYAIYEAIKSGQLDKGEMEKDIRDFLNLPIPSIIWGEVKGYYKKQFVEYIEKIILTLD